MNEQELSAGLRVFLQDRTRLADVSSVHQQVLATPIEEMPQQLGWLPMLPRFRSLFSATKFVVAGVIVALFGGFLLIAQPFGQQEASVPAAATDAAAPADGAVRVTGQLLDSFYFHGPGEDSGRLEMSDERLSGEVTFIVDAEIFSRPGNEMFLYWGTMGVENDGGAWEGTHFAAEHYAQPHVQPGPLVMQLIGSGDYEGLSAILYLTVVSDLPGPALELSLDGMIFPGDLPPDREPPDQE